MTVPSPTKNTDKAEVQRILKLYPQMTIFEFAMLTKSENNDNVKTKKQDYYPRIEK